MRSSQELIKYYQRMRKQTLTLCSPLEIEDHVIQFETTMCRTNVGNSVV